MSIELDILSILQPLMNLSNSQCLSVFPNSISIKNDGLFISVSFIGDDILTNTKEFIQNLDGSLSEKITSHYKGMYQLDIFSYNEEAFDRRHEPASALNSTYSRQQQELLGFTIAKFYSNFSNTTEKIESSNSLLNRYSYTIIVNHRTSIIYNSLDYYNNFPIDPVLIED